MEDNLLLAPIQSSVVPLPHQLYALNRAMSRDRIRYLLADEVGLGKTIEAGLILRELKLRGITQNAPHPNSIADRFRGDSLTPAFVSDLSDLIDRHRPDAWIHGHTHDFFDYVVEGGTRVVCNPKGFENDAFDWSKMISVRPRPKLFL